MGEIVADKGRDVLVCLGLTAAVAAVFAQACGFEFLSYDDPGYVTENVRVQTGLTPDNVCWAFTTLTFCNWLPLTWLSHMLDCQLFGLNPAGHHLTNILFHLANTLVLFGVLGAMTGRPWRSAFAAALFAVHPLHVESVAWIAERKDVLSTLFWLLTMGAYGAYIRHPSTGRYAAALGLFALGLLAKSMLITLPCVLFLLNYWPLKRLDDSLAARRIPWRVLGELGPFFALAAASCIVTILAQGHASAIKALPLRIRVENALVSYATYIGKMFWPTRLAVFYPHRVSTFPLWQVAGALMVLVGVTALAAVLWRRPYILVGWLWYLGTLVPVIGFIQIGGQAMADRYTYVPMIGLFVAAAWGLGDMVERRRLGRVVAPLGAAAILLPLTVLAWIQTGYWRNSETLFRRALAVTSDNVVARNGLGTALRRAGRLDEAIEHFSAAIAIPGPFRVHPHMNLGYTFAEKGQFDEAAALFAEVIRHQPAYEEAHIFLAMVRADQGGIDEAIGQYAQTLALNPDNAAARQGLDTLLEAQRGSARKPDYAMAHNALGRAFYNIGQFDLAVRHFMEALRIDPAQSAAHNGVGVVLAGQGRLDEAAWHFAQALAAQPGDADALTNLGSVLATQGNHSEAIARFTAALHINPNHVSAHYNLARALAETGQPDEAAVHYEAVLRLKPDHAPAREELERLARTHRRDGSLDPK